MATIRKGNTFLLAMQILVGSIWFVRCHPAAQLSLAPTQKVSSGNCKQNTNIIREIELTCSWVVIVPATNKFVAFANRAEGTVFTGQEYSFFVTVHFLCVRMGLSWEIVLSVDVVSLFSAEYRFTRSLSAWHASAEGKEGTIWRKS